MEKTGKKKTLPTSTEDSHRLKEDLPIRALAFQGKKMGVGIEDKKFKLPLLRKQGPPFRELPCSNAGRKRSPFPVEGYS